MKMAINRRSMGVLALLYLFLLTFFESTVEQRLSSRSELAALFELRSSLGLRRRDWPRRVDPCSGWNGVRCENGSVSGINISGFRRTRIGEQNPRFALDSLMNFTGLISFNASQFLLPGSIPDWFGQRLLKLQVLDLNSCNITGVLPLSIGNFSSLSRLYLSDNRLTGEIPSTFDQLLSLSVLDLSKNSLTGSIPSSIGTLSRLRILNLSSNSFIGELPEVIWLISGLNLLDISHNNFTGRLPNVSSNDDNGIASVLDVSRNMFYGGLTSIVGRFSSSNLSGNYFEGRVLDYVSVNASLSTNCLQDVSSQRTLTDCVSFYAERGLSFDNFGRPNSSEPSAPRHRSSSSNRNRIILAAVFGGFGFIVLIMSLLLLVRCVRRRKKVNHRGIDVGQVTLEATHPSSGLASNFSSLGDLFTYQQLLQATADFTDANLIKHGQSGDLFKGVLESGLPVVVKRIDLQSIKKEVYLSELDFFSKVAHTRVVPLLGHCFENENEKLLVYKYMSNGDLSSSLFRKNNSEGDGLKSLDWITRLKIAIGAAEGLSYLHHECTPPLVHRDVQASSILLDDKFEVRLGSLSKACPQEGSGNQNRITRLKRLPRSSEQGSSDSSAALCAYDVYCFGTVLLGLVTGKLDISASSETRMKEWLEQTLPCISIYDRELVTKILDPSLLVDEDLLEEVWAMAIVARRCLNPKSSRRPLMKYVLKALENPLRVVREDNSSSARLRTVSSRGSWNAALFGSFRQSSSDIAVTPAASAAQAEGGNSFKHLGTTGSLGSSARKGGGDHSVLHQWHLKEIFPEPQEAQEIERLGL
ncbi:putative LRR receptor-like serine/threonine-protein kinase [Hibiscus syriacus]|uniref:LRR receptor-like serine/threonine-protein kinase n=1 Tax=Hibiscus syriacus TaxID=106335 RepID=A0A6A3BNL8_HIBSY|nr:probable LRR receptor-like serine/threonine-protein kinase At2g16250 [Hibiscus syriacus]KAE8716682.1 putative LRR receptor-like serine/threonine-protein kinase [Hibiscus syriacus]